MQKITIVIPCYNEADRLPVTRILSFLKDNPHITVCFANDGSKDQTKNIIDTMASQSSQVKALHFQQNAGKAQVIRQAMLEQLLCNDSQWFGYWDADLATPLEEITHLLSHANDSLMLLMCSRVKRMGASVNRHFWRHILGRIMATLISIVLKAPVYDTQCGAKLLRREEVQTVFAEKFLTKWLFDVEIIARLKNKYSGTQLYQRVLEVPVHKWEDVPGSKLKFRHMVGALIDIIKIYLKYNISNAPSNERD